MGYKLRTSCVVCTPEEGELHTDFVLTVWDTDTAVVTALVVVFTGNGFFFDLVFPLDFLFSRRMAYTRQGIIMSADQR